MNVVNETNFPGHCDPDQDKTLTGDSGITECCRHHRPYHVCPKWHFF